MDSQFLLLLISFCLLSIFTLLRFKNNKKKKRSSTSHDHFKPFPVLGHLPQFLKNRRRFHDWMADILAASPTNTLVFRRPGNIRGVVTANPANVEHILKSNFDNFPKGPRVRSILFDFFGNGMVNTDGYLWKVQRRTYNIEFNTRSFRNLVVQTVQFETAARLLPLLKKCAQAGQVVDMQDVLERYAFDNICKVAFDEDPACLADDATGDKLSGFADAFRDAVELSTGRFRYVVPGFWKIKKLFGVGSERKLKESISTVHDFALQIIRSRLKENSEISAKARADDLLSRCIALAEEHSEEFLGDTVISSILAGRETTSSALTWFFWLLSSRPNVQQRILEEIASVRARTENRDKETFEFNELREMQFLHAALTESMRLYPPVPTNVTWCKEDDVLPDGTEVKRGWFVSYNSYAMGRMEAVWGKDCKEYKPERWLDDDGMFRPESPFKFLAFHGGPRMCLGKEMAYIQMKSIAACVLEKFVVEVVEKDKHPERTLSLTLRMRGGLPVRVRNRPASNTDAN